MFGMYGHDFISIILYQIDRFRHRTFRLGIFLSKSYACNRQEKKDYLNRHVDFVVVQLRLLFSTRFNAF